MKRVTILKRPATISSKAIDPDNPPWSEEMLGPAKVRRGRGPQKTQTKVLTTIRLDANIVAYFRAQGTGYQSRINEALKQVVSADTSRPARRDTNRRAAT